MDEIKISKETQELLNKLIEDARKKLPDIKTFQGNKICIESRYNREPVFYKVYFQKIKSKGSYIWKVKNVVTK